ncbi:MAG: hypothetical protein VB066_05760 [Paludibacter sp.]|nr:hypothetical protein [Paludibacter sp.]
MLKILDLLRTFVKFLNASTIQLYDLLTPIMSKTNKIKTVLKTQFSVFAFEGMGFPSYLIVAVYSTVSIGTAGVSVIWGVDSVSGI